MTDDFHLFQRVRAAVRQWASAMLQQWASTMLSWQMSTAAIVAGHSTVSAIAGEGTIDMSDG